MIAPPECASGEDRIRCPRCSSDFAYPLVRGPFRPLKPTSYQGAEPPGPEAAETVNVSQDGGQEGR